MSELREELILVKTFPQEFETLSASSSHDTNKITSFHKDFFLGISFET